MATLSQTEFYSTNSTSQFARNYRIVLTVDGQATTFPMNVHWQLFVGSGGGTGWVTCHNMSLTIGGTNVYTGDRVSNIFPGGAISSGDVSINGNFNLDFVGGYYNYADTSCRVSSNVTVGGLYTPPTLNSWSASLSPSIIYLKSTITHNISMGSETLSAENEISNTNTNIVKQKYIYQNRTSAYNGTDTYTATAQEIIATTGLGVALYSNLEIFNGNGSYTIERYSSAYTPPSNLTTAPTVNNISFFKVKRITATSITFTYPTINWVRAETTAFYSAEIMITDTTYFMYQNRGQSRKQFTDVTYLIESNAYSNSYLGTPTTETTPDVIYSNFSRLKRGQTLDLILRARSVFLGQTTIYTGRALQVYIPYIPTLNFTNVYFYWVIEGNMFRYRINYALVTVTNSNPDVENRHFIYFGSFTLDNTPLATVTGNQWNANTSSAMTVVNYTNTAKTGVVTVAMRYATNYYDTTQLDPVFTQRDYSLRAGLVSASISGLSVTGSRLRLSSLYLYSPDMNLTAGTTNLTLGRCDVILQVSKSSTFNTISYQQTKTITRFGANNGIFDDINMVAGDSGVNYVRVIWKLSTSANLSGLADVTSNRLQVEFVGIAPVIDQFEAWIGSDQKIHVLVKESTGSPTPTLQVEAIRIRGQPAYETFTVQNNQEYILPYDEPGTVWYILAKATNPFGTVYALDEYGEEKYFTTQIPYTTTPNYDVASNPRITASPVQLNSQSTMAFNWVNMVSNVHHITYNITMITTNTPIEPSTFTNVRSGVNNVFNGRRAGERVSFRLTCILWNSFNEEIIRYNSTSPTVTLTGVALSNIDLSIHADKNYHSILYTLVSMNKNNNKLVYMEVSLYDGSTRVSYQFIGTDNPDINSQDLDPINRVLMDGLTANKLYTLVVKVTGLNPVDPSKIQRNEIRLDIRTDEFITKPVENERVTISNLVNNVPTTLSDFHVVWQPPQTMSKNLFNDYTTTNTVSGITITNNNDGTFTVNGTTARAVDIYFSYTKGVSGQPSYTLHSIPMVSGENYVSSLSVISGSYIGGEVTSLRVSTVDTNGTNFDYNTFVANTPVTATRNGFITSFRVIARASGIRFTNWKVAPQIEKGRTVTSFQPYIAPTSSEVVNYVFSYRKQNQSFTNISLNDLQYILTHDTLDLKTQDQVYIRIGARYLDYFGQEVIEWKYLPVIILGETNYSYFLARYPSNEVRRKILYKLLQNANDEEIIIDLYINE